MLSKSCIFLGVFGSAKNMKFLIKGRIHGISGVLPGHFYCMRRRSFVELTRHDISAAGIIVHTLYTAVFMVHIVYIAVLINVCSICC